MTQFAEIFKALPMDQMVESLKYIGGGLAIVAPPLKAFFGRSGNRARELEERHTRVKDFFAEGPLEMHPLRLESAFGAVVGHTRLDALEIPLILRQRKPTSFMSSYIQVRGYIGPSADGTRFELRSIAAYPILSKAFSAIGIVFYGLFLLSSIWLLLYLAPKLAMERAWSQFALTLIVSPLFAAAGFYVLLGASHPYWAKRLYSSQRET